MRTENQFNSYLGKYFKKYQPETYAIKVSDRFSIGISDFLIFSYGKAMALETKFILAMGSDKSDLLTHPFSGAQMTFLESIGLTTNQAWGMVTVYEEQKLYCVKYSEIPPTGNWKTGAFKKETIFKYDWDKAMDFVLEHLQ